MRVALVLACLLLPACQQQMAEQPSYRPLERSEFFGDERASRPLVPGTVARGQLRTDGERFTGLAGTGARMSPASVAALVGLAVAGGIPLPAGPVGGDVTDYVDTFPFPLTEADLARGRERYTIFCAVCHDPLGNGNGKIVERGYTHPPNFHTDDSRGLRLRGIQRKLPDVPAGYYFNALTNGFGAMPDYAAQVPADDRWRIIAYIRALQLSQRARLADLPPNVQEEAKSSLEKQRERGSQPPP